MQYVINFHKQRTNPGRSRNSFSLLGITWSQGTKNYSDCVIDPQCQKAPVITKKNLQVLKYTQMLYSKCSSIRKWCIPSVQVYANVVFQVFKYTPMLYSKCSRICKCCIPSVQVYANVCIPSVRVYANVVFQVFKYTQMLYSKCSSIRNCCIPIQPKWIP